MKPKQPDRCIRIPVAGFLLILLLMSFSFAAPWFNTTFLKATCANLSNSGGMNISGQVAFNIDLNEAYTNGSDFRATWLNGSNYSQEVQVGFWRQSTGGVWANDWSGATASGNVWVNVTAIPIGTNTSAICLYYNTTASVADASNITSAFVYGDDFKTNTTAKYAIDGAAWVDISNQWLYCDSPGTASCVATPSTQTDPANYTVEGEIQISNVGAVYWGGFLGYKSTDTGNDGYSIQLGNTGGGVINIEKYGVTSITSTSTTVAADVWYPLQANFSSNGQSIIGYNNVNTVSTADASYTSGKYGIRSYDSDMKVRNFRVRQKFTTQPSYSLMAEKNISDSLSPSISPSSGTILTTFEFLTNSSTNMTHNISLINWTIYQNTSVYASGQKTGNMPFGNPISLANYTGFAEGSTIILQVSAETTDGSVIYPINSSSTAIATAGLVICNATVGDVSLHYRFYDGETSAPINATLNNIYTSSIAGVSSSITGTGANITVCITPASLSLTWNAVENYNSTGYALNTITRSQHTNSTEKNISIYLFNSSNTKLTQLQVFTSPNIPVVGANISIEILFPPSTYRQFSSCPTNAAGICALQLIPNNIFYRYNISVPPTTSYPAEVVVCDALDTTCYRTFILGASSFLPYISSGNISGQCVYHNSTNKLNCTFADSGGVLTNYNLAVYPLGNETSVCNAAYAGSVGTLSCNVPNTNTIFAFALYGYDGGGQPYTLSSGQISETFTFVNRFGESGVLATLMLFVGAVGVSFAAPFVGLMMGILSIGVATMIGAISPEISGILIGLLFIAAVIGFKQKV